MSWVPGIWPSRPPKDMSLRTAAPPTADATLRLLTLIPLRDRLAPLPQAWWKFSPASANLWPPFLGLRAGGTIHARGHGSHQGVRIENGRRRRQLLRQQGGDPRLSRSQWRRQDYDHADPHRV